MRMTIPPDVRSKPNQENPPKHRDPQSPGLLDGSHIPPFPLAQEDITASTQQVVLPTGGAQELEDSTALIR